VLTAQSRLVLDLNGTCSALSPPLSSSHALGRAPLSYIAWISHPHSPLHPRIVASTYISAFSYATVHHCFMFELCWGRCTFEWDRHRLVPFPASTYTKVCFKAPWKMAEESLENHQVGGFDTSNVDVVLLEKYWTVRGDSVMLQRRRTGHKFGVPQSKFCRVLNNFSLSLSCYACYAQKLIIRSSILLTAMPFFA